MTFLCQYTVSANSLSKSGQCESWTCAFPVRVNIFLFRGHLYLYLLFENTFPFRGLVLVSANHRLGTSGVRFELGKWSMLVVLNLTFLNHYWFRQPSADQWRARSCLPFKQNMHNQREAWCLVKRFSCKTWKDRAINLGSFNILTQYRVLANQNRVR